MLDKQIHVNDLKLRLLMTNECNQNCSFCLNDFQPKIDRRGLYLNADFARDAIETYAKQMNDRYKLEVYFSGGEPTLHPNLIELLRFARNYDCKTILNTNGRFPDFLEYDILKYVNEIHFGVYGINYFLRNKIKRMNGKIQCVYSYKNKYVSKKFLDFYLSYNIPVKVFQDFNDSSESYYKFIEYCVNEYGVDKIQFRFTGKQENRGIGCRKCEKKCITLKAAWLFSDNSATPCPQSLLYERFSPKNIIEWNEFFGFVEDFHKVGVNNAKKD